MILKEYNNKATKTYNIVNELKKSISSNSISKKEFMLNSGFSPDKLDKILNGQLEPTNEDARIILNSLT